MLASIVTTILLIIVRNYWPNFCRRDDYTDWECSELFKARGYGGFRELLQNSCFAPDLWHIRPHDESHPMYQLSPPHNVVWTDAHFGTDRHVGWYNKNSYHQAHFLGSKYGAQWLFGRNSTPDPNGKAQSAAWTSQLNLVITSRWWEQCTGPCSLWDPQFARMLTIYSLKKYIKHL